MAILRPPVPKHLLTGLRAVTKEMAALEKPASEEHPGLLGDIQSVGIAVEEGRWVLEVTLSEDSTGQAAEEPTAGDQGHGRLAQVREELEHILPGDSAECLRISMVNEPMAIHTGNSDAEEVGAHDDAPPAE